MVIEGSLALRNHLAVRDTLRTDPDLREQYERVKRQVAAVAPNIDDYGQGKSETMQRILTAAGLTNTELASIDANQVPSHKQLRR